MKAFSYIFTLTLITGIFLFFLNCHSLVVIDCQVSSHFLIQCAREGGTPSVIHTNLANKGGGGAVRKGLGSDQRSFLSERFGGAKRMGGRWGEHTGQEKEKWTLEPHSPQPF